MGVGGREAKRQCMCPAHACVCSCFSFGGGGRGGGLYAINTEFTTGNYCITAAADHIRRGDADLMLAGGADEGSGFSVSFEGRRTPCLGFRF